MKMFIKVDKLTVFILCLSLIIIYLARKKCLLVMLECPLVDRTYNNHMLIVATVLRHELTVQLIL